MPLKQYASANVWSNNIALSKIYIASSYFYNE